LFIVSKPAPLDFRLGAVAAAELEPVPAFEEV